MTTVAYKDGVIAGDTMLTSCQDTLEGYCTKIGKNGDFLTGISGELTPISTYLKWFHSFDTFAMKHFDDWTELDGTFRAILVHRDGRRWSVGPFGVTCEVTMDLTAIGSGEDLAKGALAAGATPAEAVAIAIQFDPYSGGKVDTLAF